jgi:integrase
MQKNLTSRFCETVKAPSGNRLEVADSSPRSWNLILRVSPTAKSWEVRFRINGKRRRIAMGGFPSVSLEKARTRSLEIGAMVADGQDPVEAEAGEKRAALTFRDVANEYIESYCKKHQRTWERTERLFEKWIIPALGDKLLVELNRSDVLDFLHGLEEAGLTVQQNRLLSQVKACLTWCVEGPQYLPANPVATLYRRKRRVPESSRERVLSPDELKAIWQAVDGRTDPARAFVKVLALLGQRRDEIRLMQWNELDLQARTWLLPGGRNKSNREHLVPLAEPVAAILDALPRLGDFVFTVDGRKPYAGHTRLKRILDRESMVTGWVYHDLRRTFRTGLSELHVPLDVRRRCMNHAIGGLDRVYDRHDFLGEKRDAFERWAEHVMLMAGERGGENVVVMKR